MYWRDEAGWVEPSWSTAMAVMITKPFSSQYNDGSDDDDDDDDVDEKEEEQVDEALS